MDLGKMGMAVLGNMGINAEELIAVIEQYKIAIPQFCINIDKRITAMEANLAAINNKLDLLLEKSGHNLSLPEETSHAGFDHQN